MLKRKFSRLDTILIVVAALALVLVALLYSTNMQSGDEEAAKKAEVNQARIDLEQAQALSGQIDGIQAQLEEAFPSQEDANEMMFLLDQWAEDKKVEIITLSCTPGSEKLGEADYPTLLHTLEVKGKPDSVTSFLSQIFNSELATVVGKINASYPEDECIMSLEVKVYYQSS